MGGAEGDGAAEVLAEQLKGALEPTSVIVCIGQELAGDDAAGVAVGRAVAGELPWRVVEAGTAPESFLVKVAAAGPASVLLVDAAHFGGEPGEVRLLDAGEIAGPSPGTHGPSPAGFLALLNTMHPCRARILGIQPAAVEIGAPLSAPVRDAVERVVRALRLAAEVDLGRDPHRAH